jgi:preprotein translocase subunit YajC
MSGSGFAQFIPLILIFVIFYFFLIRPQQKKVKEHKIMVTSLKRGDDVITSGGIVGKIDKVHEDDKIDLIISDDVIVKIVKSTIQSLINNNNTKK